MKTESAKINSWSIIQHNMRQYSMFIVLLLIMGTSHFLTNGLFLTPRNLTNLFLQTGYIAVLAIGMVMVIIGGHIDLAIGSVVAFCAAIAAYLQVRLGYGTLVVWVVALLIGMAAGGIQGTLVAYVGLPAFIVTLAGMMFFRGVVLGITRGNTIAPFAESFRALGSGYLPDFLGNFTIRVTSFGKPIDITLDIATVVVGAVLILILIINQVMKRNKRIHYGFEVLGLGFFLVQLLVLCLLIAFFTFSLASYKGIPYTIIVVGAFVVLYAYLSNRTKIGRNIYAVGGNALAAELSGINVKFTTFMMFVSMGFLSAVSGMLFAARMNSAAPSHGTAFELEAIAASYVGGVSAKGGIGTVTGAVIGALIIASINNCMSLLNAAVWQQYMIKGVVLVIAVLFDIMTRKKKG